MLKITKDRNKFNSFRIILTKNYTSYFAPKVLQFLFLCLKGITIFLKQSHKANNIRKDLFTRLMIV